MACRYAYIWYMLHMQIEIPLSDKLFYFFLADDQTERFVRLCFDDNDPFQVGSPPLVRNRHEKFSQVALELDLHIAEKQRIVPVEFTYEYQ